MRNRNRRSGFSLIELLICVAIVIIVGAMVVPHAREAMMSANETSALQSIQTISTAQAQYFALNHGFARSLTELKSVQLTPALLDGQHSGYQFTLEAPGAGGSYILRAKPQRPGSSGKATYYSDESLVVRVSRTSEPAGPDSPPIE